uniref:hypothetical protein n=1 Tax=Synechococcus sp. TaxID=1131 RepID=UPI0018676184|nr:hypothetical protein [Synechococcus sp.]
MLSYRIFLISALAGEFDSEGIHHCRSNAEIDKGIFAPRRIPVEVFVILLWKANYLEIQPDKLVSLAESRFQQASPAYNPFFDLFWLHILNFTSQPQEKSMPQKHGCNLYFFL